MLSRKGRFPVVFTVNNVNLLAYIVEDAMQGELSAREARIAKYTAKYKKEQRREVLLCKLEFTVLIPSASNPLFLPQTAHVSEVV